MKKEEKKICPRCGKVYNNYPSISRYDNKTLICTNCGIEEAIINYAGGKLKNPNIFNKNIFNK